MDEDTRLWRAIESLSRSDSRLNVLIFLNGNSQSAFTRTSLSKQSGISYPQVYGALDGNRTDYRTDISLASLGMVSVLGAERKITYQITSFGRQVAQIAIQYETRKKAGMKGNLIEFWIHRRKSQYVSPYLEASTEASTDR
ncbi:archaellum operon transcriptional activator EarA family protein [Methanocella sp. MCL-LM]|uniref:archaellum operon transcriptional activator EarA family protein n=1 Tax=Methanocella sp. MCL-LM TaxID=3412035 RepID=UPI003C75A600